MSKRGFDLKLDTRNLRKHGRKSKAAVAASLEEFGAGRGVVAASDGTVLGGNNTVARAREMGIKFKYVHTRGDELLVNVRDDLASDSDKAVGLALADNATSELSRWNDAAIADLAGRQRKALAKVAGKVGNSQLVRRLADKEGEAVNKIDLPDIPDPLYPSDNEFGVPTLNLEMQAVHVEQPVVRWGRLSHTVKMPGTWHFYTDDWRFNALWRDPYPVIASGCKVAVEPNISTSPTMPRAVVLYGIYRKRWMSVYFQELGIRTLVDLFVPREHQDLILLGVPDGWKAYAVVGSDGSDNFESTLWAHDLACKKARTSKVLFLVYGGGAKTGPWCGKRGFVYVPYELHEVDGREDP